MGVGSTLGLMTEGGMNSSADRRIAAQKRCNGFMSNETSRLPE